MNIVQLQKAFELMSDQELSQQQEHGFLRDTEVKRRVELRNSYQQAQQQADASKTVSEKGIEELMMGGVAGADPMAGQGGDPSMQAGVAAGMEERPQGPPMPPMMYGGGMLGFHEGGTVGHRHPHDPNNERLLHGFIPVAKGPLYGRDFSSAESFVASHEGEAVDMPSTTDWERLGGTEGEYMKLATMLSEGAPSAMEARDMTLEELYQEEQDASDSGLFLTKAQLMQQSGMGPGLMGFTPPMPEDVVKTGTNIFGGVSKEEQARRSMTNPEMYDLLAGKDLSMVNLDRLERMAGQTGDRSAYDNREQLARMLESGELTKAQYDAGMKNLLEGGAAIDPETGERIRPAGEEEEVNKELQDYLDSLSPQRDYLSEADAIVAKTLGKIQDPELYAELFAQQSDAAKAQLDRAKGIRSLRDSRAEDQRRLLADSLGLSDERIRELQGLADTPEEIASRRKAGALKDLSYMFMADPTKLPENLKEVTEGITTLDDTLKQETRDAAKEMYAARRARQTAEEVGTSGIFDTEEKSLTGMDTSQSAFDKAHANIALAKANQSIEGEMEAMKALVDLRKAQAAQQAMRTKAQNEMMNMQAARDNPLTPENWERYQMMKDDLINSDFAHWPEEARPALRAELAKTIRDMQAAYMAQVQQAGRLILSDGSERKLPVSGTKTTTTTAQS